MKLKVGKKQYTLKYGIRAMILFERLAEKAFTLEGITDWMMFAYTMLLAGTRDNSLTFDEFVDSITEADLNNVVSWASKLMAVDKQLIDDTPAGGVKKK